MATTIRGTDDSAAAPALTGNDQDTGVYFPADNTLGLVTGGTEQVRVDASGNVGIGTSTIASTNSIEIARGSSLPAGISFRGNNNSVANEFFVGQGSTGEAFVYQRANNLLIFGTNNTERMRIEASGNVGIGAAAVGGKVNANSTRVTISGTNAALYGAEFVAAGTNASIAIGSGGAASYVWTAENYPMGFGTNNNERMRITSSGNVGIGTNTPSGPLHVKGNTGTGVWGNVVLVLEDNNNDYPGIQFRGTSGELFAVRATPSGGLQVADTSGGANFFVRIGIDSSGRVTTPYQPSFKAGRSGTQTYSAGQAVIFNSEFYDIGGHYDASTGIFTAPVSGTYMFTTVVLAQGGSTGNEYDIVLTTSNASYYGAPSRIEYQLGTTWGDGYIALGAYHLVYMDANDTAYVSLPTFGGGQIYGGTTWTNFAGMLIG